MNDAESHSTRQIRHGFLTLNAYSERKKERMAEGMSGLKVKWNHRPSAQLDRFCHSTARILLALHQKCSFTDHVLNRYCHMLTFFDPKIVVLLLVVGCPKYNAFSQY